MEQNQEQRSFFNCIWDIVEQIPPGKVVTYGQIARALDHSGAARQVGWALASSPHDRPLPCHRVVNAAGAMALGDFFGGAAAQQARLEAEGVTFKSNGCIDLNQCRWLISVD